MNPTYLAIDKPKHIVLRSVNGIAQMYTQRLAPSLACVLATCLVGTSVHGCVLLFFLTASLVQDGSFLPFALALLLLPQVVIGGASGWFASGKGIKTTIACIVASASVIVSMPFGFAAIVVASRLSIKVGRPFVQHIGWYLLVVTLIGTVSSVLVLTVLAQIQTQRNQA